ncbi:MAG: SCO family protein [Alphaproteobacteria bacterium]|nr:SCO family protein [Alphaproteobacteria bacterium]
MDIKARIKRTLILCLVGLVLGGLIALFQMRLEAVRDDAQTTRSASSGIAGIKIGGPFTLVDQDGHEVTEAAFKDGYTLLYFGFTYCPAICPTELGKITQALKKVETEKPELAARVTPVFITIDPERDTPAVMKDYISAFHPRMKGFTGTSAQIETMKKLYRIYAAKVQTEGMSDYTMDHSSFIYLLSPEGEMLGLYRTEDTANMIAQDIEKFVPVAEPSKTAP